MEENICKPSDKGLISNIYRELPQLNSKNKTKQNKTKQKPKTKKQNKTPPKQKTNKQQQQKTLNKNQKPSNNQIVKMGKET